MYRDGLVDPPLLFDIGHVDSMYTAFDPFGLGYVTVEQYEEAMRTIGVDKGITPYNREPELNADGFVEEGTFKDEA